jgi:hypothetical protein
MQASPQLNRWRPAVGITPKITDAELITVSVMQVLVGYRNDSRRVRYARKPVIHLFPDLPQQPGYTKRLRALSTQLTYLITALVTDTDLWRHPVRITDSTRCRVAYPGRPRCVPRLPARPAMAIARRIRDCSGGCVCIRSPPCTICRWRSR